MAVREVYLLSGGFLMIDQSILISRHGFGQMRKIPVYMLVLKTDEGYVLLDTGLNPDGVTDPELAWGSWAKTVAPILTRDDDVRRRLHELDIKPEEIKYVINTHLHWDHTGGNRFFPAATFFVQKAEYRFAFYPDKHIEGSYMRNHFDWDLNYQLIDGDVEIAEGIYALFTPGHTPGHQSILIDTAGGKSFLVTGDAAYTMYNLDEAWPPGNCWDIGHAIASLHKLKTIHKLTGATILTGHDPDLYETFHVGTQRLA